MCLIISMVSLAFAYMFFTDGNILNGTISTVIGVFFIGLMIRNILKTKKERENSN